MDYSKLSNDELVIIVNMLTKYGKALGDDIDRLESDIKRMEKTVNAMESVDREFGVESVENFYGTYELLQMLDTKMLKIKEAIECTEEKIKCLSELLRRKENSECNNSELSS